MGSGFESQGAHLIENPADSSESAGFLRSLNFIDFGLRYRYFPLLRCSMLGRRYSPSFLQGTRPRFASDTLMSLRAIPSFLAWLPSAAMGNIYTSVHLWFRGSWNPAGGAVAARWFRVCAPCLANWGGGGLSPFSVLLGGLVFCVWGGGGLSPFRLLRDSYSGVRRGVGAVRSDIRVPEAKRGRVPL